MWKSWIVVTIRCYTSLTPFFLFLLNFFPSLPYSELSSILFAPFPFPSSPLYLITHGQFCRFYPTCLGSSSCSDQCPYKTRYFQNKTKLTNATRNLSSKMHLVALNGVNPSMSCLALSLKLLVHYFPKNDGLIK